MKRFFLVYALLGALVFIPCRSITIIIGAASYIGYHLVLALRDAGSEIIAIDSMQEKDGGC